MFRPLCPAKSYAIYSEYFSVVIMTRFVVTAVQDYAFLYQYVRCDARRHVGCL